MPENANPRPDTYFVWEPPNRVITVLLSLRLIDRMKSWMDKGLQGGEEVGGLLLGRIEEDASGEAVVTVEDCETVQISHQRGPTYTANERDRKQIAKRIAWWHANGQNRIPVGLVRSHNRSGLYLDMADFALFQQYFPGPRAIFLLARPRDDASAGFFFWENGDVRRQTTYAPFPFNREELEAGSHTTLRSPFQVAAKSVEMHAKENPPSMIRPRPSELVRLRPPGFAWLTAAAIVLVLMAAGLYWNGSRRRTPAPADFGLNIDHIGRALRLTWDSHSPALAHAGQAILSIRDGENERELALNSRQLSHGSTLYVPVSDDVEFRLQVRKGGKETAESIRSVAAVKPVAASTAQAVSSTAPGPVQAPAGSSDRIATPQHTKPVLIEENRSTAAQTVRERRRKGSADRSPAVVALAEPARVELPPVAPPPPVETLKTEIAPQPPPQVEPAARPVRHPIPTVSVHYEAAPESSLRQKIEKIPVLRLLQRNQYRGGDNFLPARPVHEVRPQLRTSVVRDLPGEWRVDLRVSIDKRGQVSEVDSMSDADERLVIPAVSAIRESRFEPAQLNGRDVSSRLLVTYRFRNPPQPATLARTAP